MREKVLTVDMTWKQSARIIAAALEAGTGEGKALARKELMRMADVADVAVELQARVKTLEASLHGVRQIKLQNTGESDQA